MRRSVSLLVAGMLLFSGSAASISPVQAAYAARISPATSSATASTEIVEVQSKRRKLNRVRNRCRDFGGCSRRGYSGSRYSDGAHDGPHKKRRDYNERRYSSRSYGRSRAYRYYDRPRYSSRSYYRRNNDAAVAAGIFGLAAGIIIGSQIDGGGSHSSCASRYRSYDPRTGTFLGYDGVRHRCY